jgi:putative phosphoribosyl transferase
MVRAIVSRGGRPDLAWDYLESVTAPTLLIVGGHDQEVLMLNERALSRLTTRKDLVVIPGATHLFEEPGTLEKVAMAAVAWFKEFLK